MLNPVIGDSTYSEEDNIQYAKKEDVNLYLS